MENVRKFKAAINRSFTCRGGILAHGIKDDQLSRYLMTKMQEFSLGVGREMIGTLIIGRQPNPRPVNAEGEFVDESDPTAVSKKVDDPDTAVYLLNEKLQVKFESYFKCVIHAFTTLTFIFRLTEMTLFQNNFASSNTWCPF